MLPSMICRPVRFEIDGCTLCTHPHRKERTIELFKKHQPKLRFRPAPRHPHTLDWDALKSCSLDDDTMWELLVALSVLGTQSMLPYLGIAERWQILFMGHYIQPFALGEATFFTHESYARSFGLRFVPSDHAYVRERIAA